MIAEFCATYANILTKRFYVAVLLVYAVDSLDLSMKYSVGRSRLSPRPRVIIHPRIWSLSEASVGTGRDMASS